MKFINKGTYWHSTSRIYN